MGAIFCLNVLLAPGVVGAQQVPGGSIPTFPVGVTVIATGRYTPKRLLDIFIVAPKKGATEAALRSALVALGIPASSLEYQALQYDVRTASSNVGRLHAALARAHWTLQGSPTQIPADPRAAKREALAEAVRLGRKQAESIAAADGERLGRLLNVEPAPVEYLAGMAAVLRQVNPLADALQNAGTIVRATELVTFELLPPQLPKEP